jgi:hypothetical protein
MTHCDESHNPVIQLELFDGSVSLAQGYKWRTLLKFAISRENLAAVRVLLG